MADISQVQAVWSGFLGAPGVSSFFVQTTDVDVEPFITFFEDIKAIFPSDVRIDLEPGGSVIQVETGDLMGGWTASPSAYVLGTGSDIYSAPSGALVRWLTEDFVDSRRVIGRTFLVPISASLFDGSGNVSDTARDLVDVAATALVSALGNDLVIWHRPKGADDGSAHVVTEGFAPARPVVLRSRRD